MKYSPLVLLHSLGWFANSDSCLAPRFPSFSLLQWKSWSVISWALAGAEGSQNPRPQSIGIPPDEHMPKHILFIQIEMRKYGAYLYRKYEAM